MLGTWGSELAKTRAESLRVDGGTRSTKSPGRLRRALGHAFVGAGERLLGGARRVYGVGIGGRV